MTLHSLILVRLVVCMFDVSQSLPSALALLSDTVLVNAWHA